LEWERFKKKFSQVGKFVVLGRTKRISNVHAKKMHKLLDKKVSEVDKENHFAGYAKGTGKVDHAISITVEENGNSLLMDNGCNVKPYGIVTLASRMDDVKNCYKMNLYYV
jgi:stage III sporulation protein SpoIIIAA